MTTSVRLGAAPATFLPLRTPPSRTSLRSPTPGPQGRIASLRVHIAFLPLLLSCELIARCMADRKRAPLPPQQEQWRSSSQLPPPQQYDRPYDDTRADKRQYIRIPPSDPNPPPIEQYLGFNPVNQNPPDGRPLKEHVAELQRREPNNPYFPRSSWNRDAMEIDEPPPSNDVPGRSSFGGMYSDRMPVAPPAPNPEVAPRAPRAMVPMPRDNSAYSSGPPSLSPTSPYSSRSGGPPIVEPPGPSSGRGRGRPGPPPMGERRWEPNDSRRRGSFSGPTPSPIEPPPVDLPPLRPNDMGRNLPERRVIRAPDVPAVSHPSLKA